MVTTKTAVIWGANS